MQVTLCDPYLSELEAFAYKRAIQIHVYFSLLSYQVTMQNILLLLLNTLLLVLLGDADDDLSGVESTSTIVTHYLTTDNITTPYSRQARF